jgi:hypothetical protein
MSLQRGPKVTSLVAREERATGVRNICMMYPGYMTQILRVTFGGHNMHQIHAGFTPDARFTSANLTQMLRAPAARGARNKGCYFV